MNKAMAKKPTVSIVTITYNQEKYIAKALESFAMQKTDFDIEVIVADDCSTDRTPEIIKKYAEKYPHLFKPIIRKKNIGITANCVDAFQNTTGKYVAFCEGDDYWTDPEKLQQQVNLMEKNPNYGLCFHPVKVFFDNGENPQFIYPETSDTSKFTISELLKHNFIQSNSVLYRSQDYKDLPTDVMPLDWYLHLYHAKFGGIGFIDRTMSAYRRHAGSVWWNSDKKVEEIWQKHGIAHLTLYIRMLTLYGDNPAYAKTINDAIPEMLLRLIDIDTQQGTKLLEKISHQFPEVNATMLIDLGQEVQKLRREIENLQHMNRDKDVIIISQRDELVLIKNSRVWKARNMTAKYIGKKEV